MRVQKVIPLAISNVINYNQDLLILPLHFLSLARSALQPDPKWHLGIGRLSLCDVEQLTAVRRLGSEPDDSEAGAEEMEIQRQGGQQAELRGEGAYSSNAGAKRSDANNYGEHSEACLAVRREGYDRRGRGQSIGVDVTLN